jgi:hypothetical protein
LGTIQTNEHQRQSYSLAVTSISHCICFYIEKKKKGKGTENGPNPSKEENPYGGLQQDIPKCLESYIFPSIIIIHHNCFCHHVFTFIYYVQLTTTPWFSNGSSSLKWCAAEQRVTYIFECIPQKLYVEDTIP